MRMTEYFSLGLDFLSAGLMMLGAVCVLVGGIGILRMPDFYTRMHASSLTDTMATLALFIGLMLQTELSLATFKLLAIMAFILLTSPTATYALANAALNAGITPAERDRLENKE